LVFANAIWSQCPVTFRVMVTVILACGATAGRKNGKFPRIIVLEKSLAVDTENVMGLRPTNAIAKQAGLAVTVLKVRYFMYV
jgi:hypothetical protein